ncbi:MAG: hypothetical protein AMJ62_14740 [Myxococcales bacterium SG8_38]|nr:MAG: hypothetical protein AMJ62_14740 [Myxococcales bacterium SG8_38]
MKKLLSVGVVALAAAAFLIPDAKADDVEGECNRIVARALGSGQACYNFGCLPTDSECIDVGSALLSFFGNLECAEAYANGELDGLGGNAIVQPAGPNAGGTKHMQEVICTSIAECGFCAAALAVGICPLYCL